MSRKINKLGAFLVVKDQLVKSVRKSLANFEQAEDQLRTIQGWMKGVWNNFQQETRLGSQSNEEGSLRSD
jgi:hypothetical protein